ncbi:hypothetical protein EXIGLDRAFT_506416 [Exidia glandulosa HHB12029]|uniref:Uncharacterized protein n=1 Tax=Exidia glandulosa HHB12029 TaxID=1314781 RepID=A0A166N4U5_EXIGL|nr:hypothetical protein EXIGLDRAFT_506416 [Exidia glandulosa HHB12029]
MGGYSAATGTALLTRLLEGDPDGHHSPNELRTRHSIRAPRTPDLPSISTPPIPMTRFPRDVNKLLQLQEAAPLPLARSLYVPPVLHDPLNIQYPASVCLSADSQSIRSPSCHLDAASTSRTRRRPEQCSGSGSAIPRRIGLIAPPTIIIADSPGSYDSC